VARADRPDLSRQIVIPHRERATLLAVAGALVLLSHAFDVVRAGGPSWPAFTARLAWSVLLSSMAWLVWRGDVPTMRRAGVLTALGSAACYLGLVLVTGGRASPTLPFSHVLVIAVPLFMPELLGAAVAAGAAVLVGVWALLWRDGASPGEILSWAHVGLVALGIGALISRALARARLAELAAAQERQAAQARLAESERLAWLGRQAGEVAHQINNPLSAARSTASFLREQAGGGDAAEVREACADLVDSLDRIAGAVRRLKQDASPPEDGAMPLGGAPAGRRAATP